MDPNESFAQVKTQILLMNLLLSINKVYSLLIQEEMQRTVGQEFGCRIESIAFVAKGQSFTPNSRKNFIPKGKERPKCTHCGKLGHTVDKFYKLHGFPPRFKFKGKGTMAHQVSSHTQVQETSNVAIKNPFSFTPDQFH